MKFIFFIFKSRYRRLALNNFLYSKNFYPYRIVNLSGPILSFFGYLIYLFNFSKKMKFISCDAYPFLKKKESGINIWLGGTNFKIMEKYKTFNNNFVTASTIFTGRNNKIQLYPCNLTKKISFEEPKIIIAMKILKKHDHEIMSIWEEKKDVLLKNLDKINDENFWDFLDLNYNNKRKQNIYVGLKDLIRINLVKKIKDNFGDRCVVIGNEWKNIIKDSLESNFEENYLKRIYKGNICVDFLAKDGDEVLYPRSIQIIESGGVLIQARNFDSTNFFPDFADLITFNSDDELIELLKKSLNSQTLSNLYKKFYEMFGNDNFNKKTLDKIFK